MAERYLHNKRIMFAIRDGINYYLKYSDLGHMEWFHELGWINELNRDYVINSVIRGYMDDTGIYFYRGYDFRIDDYDIEYFVKRLKNIRNALELGDELPVYAGVIPGIIGVRFKPKYYIGTVGDIINKGEYYIRLIEY